MNKKVRLVAFGGITAALYVVLTVLAATINLASGAIQVRFSEALCILPCFTPAAVPGLAVGCFVSNLITGCDVMDVIFGSLATLVGAVGTYLLRRNRWLCCWPPVIANCIAVPLLLIYVYGVTEYSYLMQVLFIFAGETLSCVVLGQLLYTAITRSHLDHSLFKVNEMNTKAAKDRKNGK